MMADEDTKVYFTHLNHIISALNVMKQNIDGYVDVCDLGDKNDLPDCVQIC